MNTMLPNVMAHETDKGISQQDKCGYQKKQVTFFFSTLKKKKENI